MKTRSTNRRSSWSKEYTSFLLFRIVHGVSASNTNDRTFSPPSRHETRPYFEKKINRSVTTIRKKPGTRIPAYETAKCLSLDWTRYPSRLSQGTTVTVLEKVVDRNTVVWPPRTIYKQLIHVIPKWHWRSLDEDLRKRRPSQCGSP